MMAKTLQGIIDETVANMEQDVHHSHVEASIKAFLDALHENGGRIAGITRKVVVEPAYERNRSGNRQTPATLPWNKGA